MKQDEVSSEGIILAAVVALIGTVGHFATCHGPSSHDGEWLLVFLVSIVTLAASSVNFDPKRLITRKDP